VGIAGPPGAGKSSLVDRLVACRRDAGQRVAVVAVDPSSPHSGGAVLGDRLRMQRHATDSGVFVRSMASRGAYGGVARATRGAVRVLDAAGWPWVVVETVGAGQVEVDIAQASDTTVVVLTPGWGDSIQAAKAGILEVADLFVVNKADDPGADDVARHLELALDLGPQAWRPPVVRTTATTGAGVDDLWAAVERHKAFLAQSGRLEARRSGRLAVEVRRLMADAGARMMLDRCAGPAFERMMGEVSARRLDPLAAADQLSGGEPGSTPSDRPQDRQ
jgi:LAO/AO transport system kinase